VRILIAAGGTGGHLFPGIALAEEFIRRDRNNQILFIRDKKAMVADILKNSEFQAATLDVEGIKGKGLIKSLRACLKIPGSLVQSFRIIRKFSPDIVMGVGGYVSGPAVITAHFMGTKTFIAEQNALPGITNRILGKFVDGVFLTFFETKKWFPKKKVIVTGNPTRKGFFELQEKRNDDNGKFTLLVFGGSQGSHSINQAVLSSLPYLKDLKGKLKIIHQTGSKDLEEASLTYENHGIEAAVKPFIQDMVAAFRAGDLLICRAGATSISEITASGKASLFIPFPYAANNHQEKNAEVLVKAGAAEMILEKNLNGKFLAETIYRLYHNPKKIREMEKNSKKIGNARAAEEIVDICTNPIGSVKE